MRHIVALSGGESSAAVAVLLHDIDPFLYFTDTKWEHADLYRYIYELREGMGYYRQLAISAMMRANEKWNCPIYNIEKIILDSQEDDLRIMKDR